MNFFVMYPSKKNIVVFMVCGLQLASPLEGPNYLYTCNISPTNKMEVIFLSLNYIILINQCIRAKIPICLYAFDHIDKI
jgi:hypothetical protein